MKIVKILYLLFIVLPLFAFFQKENPLNPTTIKLDVISNANQQITPISFQKIGHQEGLSSSTNSIFEDEKGFLWMTSSDGVYRYDGSEFKSFKRVTNRPEGLANSWTKEIFGDREGRMWVLSKGNILHEYDEVHEEFHKLNLIPDSSTDSSKVEVLYLLGDQKRNIWVATQNHGLNLLDTQSGQLTYVDLGEGKESVIRMMEDKDENLWLITHTHLIRLQMKNEQIDIKHYPQIQTHGHAWPIQDQAGYICIADSPSSMIRFHPEREELIRYEYALVPIRHDRVNKLYQATDGKYWIANNASGIHILDLKENKAMILLSNNKNPRGLTKDTVMDIHEDKSGGVWIALWGGGLHYYSPLKAQFGHHYAIPNLDYALQRNNLGTFYHDRKGRVWVNADALYEFEKETGRFYRFDIPHSLKIVKNDRLNDMIEITTPTNQDKFLGGMNDGLLYFDAQSGQFTKWKSPTTEAKVLEREIIQYLRKDKQQRIWIIAYGFNVFFYSADMRNLQRYELPEALQVPKLTDIIADNQQQLWAIPRENEIYRIDLNTEEAEHIIFEANGDVEFPRYESTSFWKDSRGQQWIGTYQGLFLVIPPTEEGGKYRFRSFTELDGLPDIAVHGILEDEQGFIWLSTNEGLSKMNTKTYAIKNYTQEDGLQGQIFHYNSYYKNSATGDLYFGGGNGFNVFHPEDIEKDTVCPALALIEVKVFRNNTMERVIPQPSPPENPVPNIVLFHEDKVLKINYAALHFAAPNLNKYAIQLEGFEEDWRLVGNEQEATYTNLDAGTYSFKVKAANKDGVWSDEETTLRIVVRPPWWETWWAYSIYILVLIACIAVGFSFLKKRWELRNRLKLEQEEAARLKELDHFKTKLYTNLTHEFRTPLTVILGMAEQIESNPQRHLEEGLGLIRRNSKNLLRLINQLLDLSKLENNSFQIQWKQSDIIPYLKYITQAFQSYAMSKNIAIRFFSPVETLIMDYDSEQIKQVLSNLISNAIKFTPSGGEILIKIKIENDYLNLIVQDTGIGIDNKNLPHIFDRFYQVDGSTTRQGEGTGIGLAYTQELVKAMDGEISVSSRNGEGSTFLVTLPIRRDAKRIDVQLDLQTGREVYASEILELSNLNINKENPQSEQNGTTIKENTSRVLPRILIIEDNPDVVIYLKSCLKENYQIDVAYNGRIGIEKALERTPDLIISDVMMPEKDGFEVCNSLKNDERSSHIPIVLLTAKADIASKLIGLKRGADAYLAKPFVKEELLVRLEKLLVRQERLKVYFTKLINSEQPAIDQTVGIEEAVKIEDAFIQRVRTIIDQNYQNEHFGLPQLCQKIGMSRSQLYRKMKALSNTSPSEFIKTYRLKKAKILLETGDFNVAEAAFEVGFSDPSYFSKIFQKEFEFLPSETSK